MSTATQYHYLEPDSKSNYKQLVVKGRGVKARTLYGHFMSTEEPRAPQEIAADYDLPLAAVHEAFAYCQTDPPEIREDSQREADSIHEMGLDRAPFVPHHADSV